MKHIIVLLALGLLLTGCFGGEKQEIDDGWVVAPDVVVDESTWEDTTEIQAEGDADTKDDDSLGEINDDENTEVNKENTDSSVDQQESEDTQEVLNEFEDDLDDIFKDLGL